MIDPSLKRKRPLSRFPKKRPQVRIGKLGIVRLYGKAKTRLRQQCFDRDYNTCVDCGRLVAWDEEEAIDFCLPIGEMSHLVSLGAGGSDVISNVVTRCKWDHQKSHNCNGKPLPKKESHDGN